ncbi:MAG: hypothetical protein AAFV85_27730 [Cyanobacteria bacterium J06634_6]
MMVSVKGTFHNGVVQLNEPITDREGQTVIITFVEEGTETAAASGTVDADREIGWDQLMQSIEQNTMDTGIEDLSHQHDHYLHGKPKQG